MELTKEMLDTLTEEAKKSPRLRMNRDMRTSPADSSQRMLNAIEPESMVPVHRHPKSTETVCVLRGAVRQSFFEEVATYVTSEDGLPMAPDADGMTRKRSLKLVEQYTVEAGSPCPMYVVPAGMWHTTEALVSGTIIFESKDGRYGEDGSESFA